MRPANSVVAVVDDEDNIRETVGFALRREGYPVELYATGLEAWQSFQRKLPGLNGEPRTRTAGTWNVEPGSWNYDPPAFRGVVDFCAFPRVCPPAWAFEPPASPLPPRIRCAV